MRPSLTLGQDFLYPSDCMIAKKIPCQLLVLLCLFSNQTLHGEAVSTKPPAPYEEKLESLLTPSDELLNGLPKPPEEAEDGWVLLDEEVQHVLPDGRRLIVEHRITRALTDAGAEELGRSVRSYQVRSQKMHLVLARTIHADGKKQPVSPEAMFLQTPQREADDALYNDTGELVLIFPGMKAGATTEWIVVKEELKPRITGHFTSWLTFDFGWPMHLARGIIELPQDYAGRLQITSVGPGVPEARREDVPGNRTRWTWERRNAPASRDEPHRAPFLQTGPVVRLTTLKDWGEFLRWYVPLANRRTTPGSKLAAEVEEMTKDAKNPRDVLDILTARVANDVRYVGLEFGDSDLEPHAVAEVWEHQYGDCKDKASLLRAMLTLKGIPAHVALVNTDHLGRIEKRSPDFRDFDHVIVVAELPDGPVFCDPTISGAPAGMISPNDADRDVLLVKEPEQWMRTPPQHTGRYSVNFDAKITTTGEISGWATLEADGYMGTRYSDAEARGTRQQLTERLVRRVGGCFPGARVVDIKPVPRSASGAYQVQAYFVVPPTGALTLPFPLDPQTLPDIGDGENRETDVFLWQEITSTSSTFTLPDGFRAVGFPPPHALKSSFAAANASWEQKGRTVHCTLTYDGKASRVPAADCRAFAQTLASLRAWLAKPVALEAGTGAAPAPAADDLGEFPLMPTGEGQLALVNERFPISGNRKLRRQALERTLAWFPKDKPLQFNAQVQLAYLDSLDDRHEEALARLRGPLETLRGSADADDEALGDYILGLTLKRKGDQKEALAVFTKVGAAKDVGAFRRAWSLQQCAELLAKSDPAGATTAAEAGLRLEGGAESALFRELAASRLTRHEADKLSSTLKAFLEKEGPATAEVLVELARLATGWAGEKPREAAELLDVLTRQGDLRHFGREVSEALEEAGTAVGSGAALVKVRERLQQWVKDNPAALPAWQVPDSVKTADDFTKAIKIALDMEDKDAQAQQLIRLAVESLMRFAPAPWYEERLHRAASYADFMDRIDESNVPPPVLGELLDLCDLLPPSSETNQEARFLRASMLGRMKRLEEAGKVLHALLEDPEVSKDFKATAITRHAANCLSRKDPVAALRTWHKLSDYSKYHSAPTEILRAILVSLESGKQDEALQFLAMLRTIEPSVIEKTEAVQHVRSFLEFAKDDTTAIAWWEASAKWWPEWLAFARKHGEPAEEEWIVPVIPDLSDFGRELGEHGRAGRRAETFAALSKLAHAGRWQPAFASELATMLQYFPTIQMEEATQDFRTLIIAMHDADKGSPQLESLHLWALVSLIDGGKVERVAEEARKFLERQDKTDGFTAVISRLWAVAATQTGKDLPHVASLLEGLLTKPPEDDERYRTVSSLASVYRKQGRTGDEMKLLEKELTNPDLLKAGDAINPMKDRLDALREGAGSGDGPALAAKAWLAAKTPGWFHYARPKDLEDPKAANPDEAMIAGSQLSAPEAARLCLLIAQDSAQPEGRRMEALGRLGWHTGAVSASDADVAAWITAIIDEKSLPRKVRATALDSFLRHSFVEEHVGRIKQFAKHPILQSFTEEEGAHLKAIRRYGSLEQADLAGALTLGEELQSGTLNYFAAETVQRMIRRLAFSGRTEEAQKLAKGFSSARFAESIAREKSSHQLVALKTITLAKKLNPVQDALRELYLSKRQVPPEKAGAEIAWRNSSSLNLPEAEATKVREGWIRDGTWPRDRLHFWFEVTADLPREPAVEDLSLALLTLALEKAPDDQLRSQLISGCAGWVDIDNENTRNRLDAVLKPHRNLQDAPLTKDALRMHDLRVRLRTGTAQNAVDALNAISDSRMRHQATWGVLRSCIGQADKAGLRHILDGMDAEELLSPGSAPLAATAYRLLGMSDEAELATERCRDALYDAILAAWADPWGIGPSFALEIARETGTPALVPEAFSVDMATALKHEQERLFFLVRDAYLRAKWDACAQHAAEGRKRYPTFYDFYGMEGEARAHLGQKKEAASLLETFLKYSHNEPNAAKLKELLRKLKE